MFFASAALLSAFASLAAAQGNLLIQTPASLVECQPTLLSFSGGVAPYFISALPAGQVSAAPLLNLPEQAAAGTYTWTVNLPAGTNISLQIRDGSGALNYGSPVVVQAGTSTACLDQAAASSASAAGAIGSATSAPASSAAAASSGASSMMTALTSTTGSATSATVTAASGTPSSTATSAVGGGASANSTGNFTCTQGLLTYGISTASLGNVTLAQATRFFSNLTASQPTATNVSGTEIMFMAGNLTYSFNMTLDNVTASGVHQQFEFLGTEPVNVGPTVLYDAFEDLQVYRNATTNQTEVQYFILGCFSEQPAGLTVLSTIIGAAISSWTGALTNSTMSAPMARRLVKLF